MVVLVSFSALIPPVQAHAPNAMTVLARARISWSRTRSDSRVKLPSMSEVQVRAHTRLLIERCAPGGGWALGSGNSIPEYVPVANLISMLSEGYAAGRY